MNPIKTVGITKEFDGIVALHEVSISVDRGEILGIIGPNGAGKTTLLNIVNGILSPDRGRVYIHGRRTDGLPSYDVARMGIARTFQITRIFNRMTVLENMLSASIMQLGRSRRATDRAHRLLEAVNLAGMEARYAEELSGGQRKLLEFARALMPDPQVILMDEPFAGVHPEITAVLIERVRELHGTGRTFLIVSHDMARMTNLCQRLAVLSYGEKLADGPTQAVLQDEAVIEAYLGRE